VPSSPRDKDATWRSAGALCREFDWSKRRLIYELENGLPYRTIPPGWTIDWHDDYVWPYFNVEAGAISIPYGMGFAAIVPPPPKTFWDRGVTLGIEVLPPTDAEVPAPLANTPAALPTPRRPSDAAVEQCFRGIMKERPDDPPDEKDMLAEMKGRLGAPPGRERVRNIWKTIAPQWKRPRGHPRNFNSAKKSAV
jgi:hypothetical protein